MSTVAERVTSCPCGAEVRLEVVDGGPFAHLADLALRGARCPDCAEREEREARREAEELKRRDRLRASGMPADLRRVTIEQLSEVPPNAIAAALEWGAGKRGGLVFTGRVGVGKAQPLDSLILTPTGWESMGALRVGDPVIGGNGRPTAVTAIHPQGIRPILRVTFNDGAMVDCDADHLWTVAPSSGPRWRTMTTAEIMAGGVRRKAGHPRWRVPVVEPIQFGRDVELPVDPYLLGALLGDGCLTRGISFSTADRELLERVEVVLPGEVRARPQGPSGYDYGLTAPRGRGNPLLEQLRGLGLMGKHSETKFIPLEYLLAPPAAREELLRGLLDTDGFVSPSRSNIEYTTVSPLLAEDVRFLVRSLGGLVRTAVKQTTHQPAFRLTISPPVGLRPFSLKRKAAAHRDRQRGNPSRYIVSIEEDFARPAQCIAVEADDGLYVTDDFVVTHNTWLAAAAARRMAERRRFQWCSVASMMIQLGAAFGDEDRAKAIRYLTGYGPLVLDDLDKVNPSAWARQHLYAAIDNRITAGSPLLVTTNLNLAGVGQKLGEEVASRLEGYCRVVVLHGDDRRRHAYRRNRATRRFTP